MSPEQAAARVLCGRIVDCREDSAGRWLELFVFADGQRLSLVVEAVAPELARGDLVRLTQDGARARDVVVLKRPARDGAGDDAWRWQAQPDGVAPRLLRLRQRHEIIRAIRETLYDLGFIEVQAPLLVPGTSPEPHIQPFAVTGAGAGDGDGYLVGSTEYQIKRLIVGGCDRVFTLTQNFRAGERSPRHTPEFTMLEWARAFGDLRRIEDDARALIAAAWRRLAAAGPPLPGGDPIALALDRPWPRLTVREALARHLGVEVDDDFSAAAVTRAAGQVGIAFAGPDDPGLFLSALLDRLAPHLGFDAPTFLCEWPAAMTTSARLVPGKPALAERTELYIGGLEIADGFPFLDDPALQERLFATANEERQARGLATVGLDARYVSALREGIPPGAGMALGIDRLVMSLTGEREIDRVLPFAWEER